MKKALLTATVQSHIGQFHRPLAEVLHEAGYEVHVAARNNLAEKNGLSLDFADRVYDVPFSRSPKSIDNLKAYHMLSNILKEEHYDLVSCNTPMGGIVTRLASGKTRKNGTHVFYTAHGFHFYKGAPKKNWLVFYPIERIMARFCDTLITITKEDYRLAKKNFKTNVEHIHGVGVYTDRYHPVTGEEASVMRKAEGLSNNDFLILCVGELNENKNQKTLISAVASIKEKVPHLKVLLAGNGPKEAELRQQIEDAGLTDRILLLGYRTDLEKVTPAVDLVVSCSYREGLPLNILEAELCKKAVIASVNRGHNELINHGKSGYIFAPSDVKTLSHYLLECYNSDHNKMGLQGYRIASKYTSESVKQELKRIYLT